AGQDLDDGVVVADRQVEGLAGAEPVGQHGVERAHGRRSNIDAEDVGPGDEQVRQLRAQPPGPPAQTLRGGIHRAPEETLDPPAHPAPGPPRQRRCETRELLEFSEEQRGMRPQAGTGQGGTARIEAALGRDRDERRQEERHGHEHGRHDPGLQPNPQTEEGDRHRRPQNEGAVLVEGHGNESGDDGRGGSAAIGLIGRRQGGLEPVRAGMGTVGRMTRLRSWTGRDAARRQRQGNVVSSGAASRVRVSSPPGQLSGPWPCAIMGVVGAQAGSGRRAGVGAGLLGALFAGTAVLAALAPSTPHSPVPTPAAVEWIRREVAGLPGDAQIWRVVYGRGVSVALGSVPVSAPPGDAYEVAVWSSSDGLAWQESHRLGGTQRAGPHAGLVVTADGFVAAGTICPGVRCEPFALRSTDGRRWRSASISPVPGADGSPAGSGVVDAAASGPSPGRVLVAVGSTFAVRALATSAAMWRSEDGGRSWRSLPASVLPDSATVGSLDRVVAAGATVL